VANPHEYTSANPLKQAIMDGITNWLKDQAPSLISARMSRADVYNLLDSIAAAIGVEHVEKSSPPGDEHHVGS
jgi:hypothetical protein